VAADRVWENYGRFLCHVLPVAEEAGVRLGMHPDDPPLPSLGGVGRILHSLESFDRSLALSDSASHGVTFCQANFQLMTPDVEGCARHFAAANRIVFIHYRNVRGTSDDFEETFHDEAPEVMVRMLKVYGELGLDVPLRVDHVPTLAGEAPAIPGYGAAGRLFAIGYIKGVLQSLGIPYE
jgi:mannonate dehydratase